MPSPLPPLIPATEDSRKTWKSVNALRQQFEVLQRDHESLKSLVAARERREFGKARLPFALYTRPLYQFSPAEREADVEGTPLSECWWRIFYVQAGKVENVECDLTNSDETPIEVIVPLNTAEHWVWVEITMNGSAVESAEVKQTETPGTHWTGYPATTSLIRPLAMITTTDSAPATVRQFQLGDIWLGGSGGSGQVWL